MGDFQHLLFSSFCWDDCYETWLRSMFCLWFRLRCGVFCPIYHHPVPFSVKLVRLTWRRNDERFLEILRSSETYFSDWILFSRGPLELRFIKAWGSNPSSVDITKWKTRHLPRYRASAQWWLDLKRLSWRTQTWNLGTWHPLFVVVFVLKLGGTWF